MSDATDKFNGCGVGAIDTSSLEDIKRTGCIAVDDFYEAETFECLKCPSDLLSQEFYISVGVAFGNLCEVIANFLEDHFTTLNIDLGELTYSFLVCEKGNLRGACGYESFNGDGKYKFKLYINPLTLSIDNDLLHNFTMLWNIATHEMAHTFLHALNAEMYHVNKNYHCPEFFDIVSTIDEFFYDRENLMYQSWDYAKKYRN
jgi:hypothetical protein